MNMESMFGPSPLLLLWTHSSLNHSLSYWTMHFDSSPEKQKGLSKLLRKDPRVIRATVLKMGDRIEDVAWKYPKTIISAPDVPGVP
jgi:Ribosomal protein S6